MSDLSEKVELFNDTATAVIKGISNYKKDPKDRKKEQNYYEKKLTYFTNLMRDLKVFFNDIVLTDPEKNHDFFSCEIEGKIPEQVISDLEKIITEITNIINSCPTSNPDIVANKWNLAKNIVEALGSNDTPNNNSENKIINTQAIEIKHLSSQIDGYKNQLNALTEELKGIKSELSEMTANNRALRLENHRYRLENLKLISEMNSDMKNDSFQNSTVAQSNKNKISDIMKLVPKFNGKSDELRVYISKLDDLFQYVSENDEALFVTVVKTNLTGEAAIEILDEEDLDTWSELKASLLKSFKNHENHVNDIALLQQMKQNQNENVEGFCSRIKKVLSKLKSVIPVGATRAFWFAHTERYAVQCLEDGLLDVKIQARLVANKPTNFQAAVQFVIDTESRLNKNQVNTQSDTSKVKSSLYCRYCRKNNHTIEDCKLRTKNNEKKNSENKTEEFKCTICNKNTHTTDICYKNPKNANKADNSEKSQ
jgi:regulator of replication initiation timing